MIAQKLKQPVRFVRERYGTIGAYLDSLRYHVPERLSWLRAVETAPNAASSGLVIEQPPDLPGCLHLEEVLSIMGVIMASNQSTLARKEGSPAEDEGPSAADSGLPEATERLSARRMSKGATRNTYFTQHTFGGRLCLGETPLQYNRNTLANWLANFRDQHQNSNYNDMRFTRVSLDGIVPHEFTEAFGKYATRLVERSYITGIRHSSDALFTPKGTFTEIHHDSCTHVTLAKGRKSLYKLAMKLWLFWPTQKIPHLLEHHDNGEAFAKHAGQCIVLAQYSGDVMVIPANWPHMVLTLQDSYLYGNNFDDPSQICYLRLEELSGEDLEEQAPRVIKKLQADLVGQHRKTVAQQFLANLPVDLDIYSMYGQELLDALKGAIDEKGDCLFCQILRKAPVGKLTEKEHLCAHLLNQNPGSELSKSMCQLWLQHVEQNKQQPGKGSGLNKRKRVP